MIKVCSFTREQNTMVFSSYIDNEFKKKTANIFMPLLNRKAMYTSFEREKLYITTKITWLLKVLEVLRLSWRSFRIGRASLTLRTRLLENYLFLSANNIEIYN